MIVKKPLISICIPTYNRTKFLLLALNSCYKQTYQNFEIIITDNSDSDETQKAVAKQKNKKIRYYKNSKNIGSFGNLIKVAGLANGKYIKFLLDDDLIEANCLEKMVNIMESNNNLGIVCAPLKIIDQEGKEITPKFYLVKKMKDLYRYKNHDALLPKSDILLDYLTKVYPCCVPTGIMYRKECFDSLGTFDKEFQYITDVEFCMRIATQYDFYYIDEYLSSWRYSPSSETVSILHKEGITVTMFYDLTRKYIENKQIMKVFPKEQRERIIKDSYFFASKRTTLNFIAGIKSGNIAMMIDTLKVIVVNDPYASNKIKLPFVMFYETVKALLQN